MTSGSNRDNMSIQDEFTRSAGTPGGAHRGRKSLAVRLRHIFLWFWLPFAAPCFSGHG